MEIETMVRYNLPIVIIIVNNGGIYGGFDQSTYDSLRSEGDLTKITPPTALTVETKYEAMMNMFGQKGFLARDIPQLETALNEALTFTNRPTIINVLISPSSDRKAQTHSWLTVSKL